MLKDKLIRADLYLLVLFIAYCAAVVLRVSIEGTGYTSPDSEYYMEAARSFRDGENFVIRDLYGLHTGKIDAFTPFTAWPIGYSVLIAAASTITGLNLFWASKLVNLLFAGLGFLLMRHINRRYSFVLASIYGAFTIIEIHSYTWSEGTFIFECLYLGFLLHKIYRGQKIDVWDGALLLLTLPLMFITRYITIFAFVLIAIIALYLYWQRRRRLSTELLTITFLAGLLCLSYLFRNYLLIGHPTGISRLHQDMETPAQVLWMALKGILVEFFLIRNYYLKGAPETLTIATTLFQITTIGYIWQLLRRQSNIVVQEFKSNLLSHTAIAAAFVYLAVLVFFRSISQFDPPNYRLLSPFTILMLFAIVNYIVALPDNIKGAVRAKYVIAGFFILSLLLNLPKKFLLSQFL